MDWAFLASDETSGGVLITWDRWVVEKLEEFIKNYTIACSFRSVEDNVLWAFAYVYGLNMDSTKSLI